VKVIVVNNELVMVYRDSVNFDSDLPEFG